MLRLTLVRHAKSEPAYSGQSDWERALEAQGLRDAPKMAIRLKERGLKPDRILSSPAVRAITTANLLASELGVPANLVIQDERLYLASSTAIFEVVRELGGNVPHLMIVGHNPGLTEFADEVSSERSVDHLPTCGVYSLLFEIRSWNELEPATGVDAELDYPNRPY
ncbi:MAG TPA: histidine phosphatase family protein [Steroidobacteraceae bacterium]